jgi:hypothetical protein
LLLLLTILLSLSMVLGTLLTEGVSIRLLIVAPASLLRRILLRLWLLLSRIGTHTVVLRLFVFVS